MIFTLYKLRSVIKNATLPKKDQYTTDNQSHPTNLESCFANNSVIVPDHYHCQNLHLQRILKYLYVQPGFLMIFQLLLWILKMLQKQEKTK